MSLAALLAGDFDDDDDDDDDSFDDGKEEEDDDEDEEEQETTAIMKTFSRLPLHSHACAGNVDSLIAALDAGTRTGQVPTGGYFPDGSPRTVSFDLNQGNEEMEPPLHATILAAANALALAAAPLDDPWVRAAARDSGHLLESSPPAPLACKGSLAAALDADAEARLMCMRLLLEAGAQPERKVYGRSALHLACACAALPALCAFASKAVELLLKCGASLSQVDACGKTPLHYAAVGFGDATLATLLNHPSAHDASALADKSGATALHDALRGGSACVANAKMLIGKGATAAVNAADVEGLTPLHLSCAAGLDAVTRLLRDEKGANPEAADAIGRTPTSLAAAAVGCEHASSPVLLLAHPASLLHNAPAGEEADGFTGMRERQHFGQPECAARLRCLLSPAGHLRGSRYADLVWKPAPFAQITDVMRCHEYSYLERVRGLCDSLAARAAAAKRAAARAKAAGVAEESAQLSPPLKASVDCDTEVTEHSYAAAMRGAGAVVEAVRAVCASPREARAAFCAVRPPGHHAGPAGAVGGQSAGFCVLANAAIGAAYGLAVHRDIVRKVAIVDFDIHHGNGTEACVQAVVPTPWTQSHETPTGSVSASGVTYQPWLGTKDKESIFFGSIHGYGADTLPGEEEEAGPVSIFYPGSGGPDSDVTDVGEGPVVRNVPVRLRTRSAAWRRQMMSRILAPLRAFAPDLVVISAGFDAHAHDALEAGGLHDRDYEWMTAELVRIAECCANGRIVSVLEGGYQVAGGFVSSLARSVGSHVSTLNQPALVGASWDVAEANRRLEAAIAYEDTWLTNRAAAQAKAIANGGGGGEAPAAPEQDNGAPARRSRRARDPVDYGSLEAELQKEEGAADGASEGDEKLASDANGDAEAPPVPEAAPVPEDDHGGSGRRSKRSRAPVDYSAAEAELQKEEEAAKKPKSAAGDE